LWGYCEVLRGGLKGIWRGWEGGVGGGEGDAAAIVGGKDLGEDLVEAADEGADGAEVGGEGDGIEEEWVGAGDLKAGFADAGKELGVGVAEEVDGLHGVADDEATAAFAVRPGGDEAAEEFVLAAAGVLELVDEDVVDAFGENLGGVGGGAVGVGEDAEGDLGDFNVVDRAGLGEDDAELGGGVAEEGEAGTDDLPVVVGVMGGRQGAGGGEGGLEAGDFGESVDEVEEPGFFGLAVGGEAEALVGGFAEVAAQGEEEVGEALIGGLGFFSGSKLMEVGGEIGELGEGLEEGVCALLAGEAGEGEGFVACAGDLIEELAELEEGLVDGFGEGAFEAFAEGVPILFALKDEAVHPAVAALEHFDEEVFHLGPIVVAPEEEGFDGGAEGEVGGVDLLEGLAGGAAVEVVGLVVDAEAVAESGEEGLLEGDVAAEGVDGGDAELGGLIEEVPAEGLGVLEGAGGEGVHGEEGCLRG
jgi:hypothetical protein